MTWKQNFDLNTINSMASNTILGHIGIEFIDFGDDFLAAKMPVDHRTKQPFGILHGGASVTLAETLGSMASTLAIEDSNKQIAVGVEINANHLLPVSEGYVYGKARPIKLGKTLHIWNIEIKNEAGNLVCVSRLTLAIIQRRNHVS